MSIWEQLVYHIVEMAKNTGAVDLWTTDTVAKTRETSQRRFLNEEAVGCGTWTTAGTCCPNLEQGSDVANGSVAILNKKILSQKNRSLLNAGCALKYFPADNIFTIRCKINWQTALV